MVFINSFRNWFRRTWCPIVKSVGKTARRIPCRLQLEPLEDRLVPSTLNPWTDAGQNGKWEDPNNWTLGVPHAGQVAVFDGVAQHGDDPASISSVVANVDGVQITNGYTNKITDAGTLDLAGDFNQADGTFVLVAGHTLSVGGNWKETATLNTQPGSTVDFTGAGPQTLASGSQSFDALKHSGTGTLQLTNPLTSQDLNNAAGVLDLNGQNLTVTATVTNAVTIQLQGTETVKLQNDTAQGTWRYVGDNTGASLSVQDFGVKDYFNLDINDTHVNADTFQAGAALDVAGALSLTAGTLDLNGNGINVTGGLSGNGRVINSGPLATLAVSGGGSLGGTITGASTALTVGGVSQTLTLSGNNTYGGLTTITGSDTLQVDTSGMAYTINGPVTGGGNLTKTGMGELRVTQGKISGDLDVQGGTFAPGDETTGTGFFTVGNATFEDNTGFDVGLQGNDPSTMPPTAQSNNELIVTGMLRLHNNVALNMAGLLGKSEVNDQLTIIAAPNVVGTFAGQLNHSFLPLTSTKGQSFQFSYGPNVVLTHKNTMPQVGPPLQVSATTIFETQTVTLSGSFTDPDELDLHTLTIDWGDSAVDPNNPNEVNGKQFISLANGVVKFDGVVHQYRANGSFKIHVRVIDSNSAYADWLSPPSITVNDSPPEVNALGLLPPVNGLTLSGTLASFQDVGLPESVGNYTATVDWGDKTPTQDSQTSPAFVQIVPSGTGLNTFLVQGTHTYSSNDVGTVEAVVTISNGNSPATTTITEPVFIGGATGGNFVNFTQQLLFDVDNATLVPGAPPFISSVGRHSLPAIINLPVADPAFIAYRANLASDDLYDTAGIFRETRDLYKQVLGRDPIQVVAPPADGSDFMVLDPGVNIWTQLLSQGFEQSRLEAMLMGSPEFFSDSGQTDQGFLQNVYLKGLGRAADPAGLAAWGALLNQLELSTPAGIATGQVALDILQSREGIGFAVTTLYHLYLHREPDPAGLQAWVSFVASGGTLKQVQIGLLSSPEYYDQVGTTAPAGTSAVQQGWKLLNQQQNLNPPLTLLFPPDLGFALPAGDAVSPNMITPNPQTQAPLFSGPSSTTFTVGAPGSFLVAATGVALKDGFPALTLGESSSDTLPSGVTVVLNSGQTLDVSTLLITGIPAVGALPSYTLNFTADNGVSPIGTLTFTLNVA
jgi:hypothetical protein